MEFPNSSLFLATITRVVSLSNYLRISSVSTTISGVREGKMVLAYPLGPPSSHFPTEPSPSPKRNENEVFLAVRACDRYLSTPQVCGLGTLRLCRWETAYRRILELVTPTRKLKLYYGNYQIFNTYFSKV